MRRLRLRARNALKTRTLMSTKKAHLLTAGIADLLLGAIIVSVPVSEATVMVIGNAANDPTHQFYYGILGRHHGWGFAFILSGLLSLVATIKPWPHMHSVAMGVTGGLAAARAVGFAFAAVVFYPEFFVLLMSGALVWGRVTILVYNAAAGLFYERSAPDQRK